MSKRSRIKLTKSDVKELQRQAKNFNAKITRLEKKRPELQGMLPERVSAKQILKETEYRQQLKATLNSLERFTRKGSEEIVTTRKGAKMTKYQKKEALIQHNIYEADKRRMAEEAQQREAKTAGRKTGMKRGEMGSTRTNELKPRKVSINNMTQKEWNKFVSVVNRQSRYHYTGGREELFKANYLAALERVLGRTYKTAPIFAKLEGMSASTIVDIFFEDEQASIDYLYAPHDEDAKISVLYDVWDIPQNERALSDDWDAYGEDEFSEGEDDE